MFTNKTLRPFFFCFSGRLGFTYPSVVSPHLETFIQNWCATLRTIKDDNEKDSAFRGLCKVVQTNPNGVLKNFVFVCDAIASWEQPVPDLKQQMMMIMHGVKNLMPTQVWNEYFLSFPNTLKEKLKIYDLP